VRRALEGVELRVQDEGEWRRQLEEAMARARAELEDDDARRRLADVLDSVREQESATRRLLAGLEQALPDEEARRDLELALQQARETMGGESVRREIEDSLRRARESMENYRAQELERNLVHEQMRRALEEAARGGELRRMALEHASHATLRIRRVGTLLRGASFQLLEPGIRRHVDAERGLLVLDLESDSPLAAAGLEAGDVILTLDGREVRDGGDLFQILGDALARFDDSPDQDRVPLEVQSDGRVHTLHLSLDEARSGVIGPL
jgi:C-terminal processing protease CtpA/Prc